MPPALDPAFVSVGDDSYEELLKFARSYAGELLYHDDADREVGDWSGLFDFSDDELKELVEFMENPGAFPDNDKKRKKFSRPHLVLFLTFLKLLRHPQKQFRDLTRLHLDFYYKDVLKFKTRPESPDSVHVLFNLARGKSEHLLKKGTLLNAGKDGEGVDLHYELNEDIVLDHARVASIKTVRSRKMKIGLESIHERHDRSSESFEKMLRWAVGRPGQGDPLPSYIDGAGGETPVDAAWIEGVLYPRVRGKENEEIGDEDKRYLLAGLCLAFPADFRYCMEIHEREIDKGGRDVTAPSESEWRRVYELVEKAWRKKLTLERREALRRTNETGGFPEMMRFAIGEPGPGDPAPPAPGEMSLDELYESIRDVQACKESVRVYIENRLCMSINNFKSIMARNRISKGLETDGGREAIPWEEVYILLEKAQTRKRKFVYPPIEREEIRNIRATSVFESKNGEAMTPHVFKPLGSGDRSSTASPDQIMDHALGFAVTSPVLLLDEGDREIMLAIACKADTLDRDKTREILREEPRFFDVFLSTAEKWTPVESARFDVGDFILEEELRSLGIDSLSLVCVAPAGSFRKEDVGKYIQFEDGSIYRIDGWDSDSEVTLRPAGVAPADNTVKMHDGLKPEGGPTPLDDLVLDEENRELKAAGESFDARDRDRFIVLRDGRVYRVEDVIDVKRAKVRYRGVVDPSHGSGKYERISFEGGPRILSGASVAKVRVNSTDADLESADAGSLIVWDDGAVMRILGKAGEGSVHVEMIGRVPAGERPRLHRPSSIYFNAIRIRLTLPRKFPPIEPFKGDAPPLNTHWPAVKVLLRDLDKWGVGTDAPLHETMKAIRIDKVAIHVDVKNLKEIRIRNDAMNLDPASPFQPFGDAPKVGAGFYFANREVAAKKLDSLTVELEWMGLPKNLGKHYEAYANSGLDGVEAVTGDSFETRLKLLNHRDWMEIGEPRKLFKGDRPYRNFDLQRVPAGPGQMKKTPEDPREMPRCLKLELQSRDFMHDIYPLVLNITAMKAARGDGSVVHVYPPYTPLAKSITLDYTSSMEIDLTAPPENRGHESDRVFHLHPFGWVEIRETGDPDRENGDGKGADFHLFPQYNKEGYLFIGIADLKPPRTISILFQMIAGSGDPELPPPGIEWSYLSRDRWRSFRDTEILSDSTNGLLASGILRLAVPGEARADNTLMPGGLHWIRAAVGRNAAAVCDSLDIRTQAARADFKSMGNAADHLAAPLAGGSIKALAVNDPAVKGVEQSYSSSRGRMKEGGAEFYTRVGERQRHRNRALTAWDYERIVLERFPRIYKVKCLDRNERTVDSAPASVTLVVIPDISNTKPFFPRAPKVSLDQLKEIETYVKKITSPFVRITVRNPRYEQIKYRVAVRLKPGYDQGYYFGRLNDEIVRFLSPWAYEEEADISFGSGIHDSILIDFIEKRPYVDYVANLKLVEQIIQGGEDPGTAMHSPASDAQALARVSAPDAILVSAPEHIIDRIETETYEEEDFEGVGYMIIGADFKIRPPGPAFIDIGFMKIGETFKVY